MKEEILTVVCACTAAVVLGIIILRYLGTATLLAVKLSIPVALFVGIIYTLGVVLKYKR